MMYKKIITAITIIGALTSCNGNTESVETAAIDIVVPLQAQAFIDAQPATIQIALLLDTSNSMDGLIDQARTQLWDIVNKMSGAHCNDQQALLEIAIYEYGNSRLTANDGYVRKVIGFSTDLDQISKELFGLRTNGGEEYCGTAIGKSLDQLQWSNGSNDLKLIFIAGNEGFNQGNVPFSSSIAQAIEKDIVVNTIFCGDWNTGTQLRWKEGATLGKGEYMNLDHNQKSTYVSTPYDDEILRYNTKLNDTYIAYGNQGYLNKVTQTTMDAEVEEISVQANVKRTLAKSSNNYRNSSWDLVDAMDKKEARNELLKEENRATLPANLKDKTIEEITAYAKAKKQERISIQNKIQELNEKREKYLMAESKTESNGLESAMFKAIKKQSETKKFTWK